MRKVANFNFRLIFELLCAHSTWIFFPTLLVQYVCWIKNLSGNVGDAIRSSINSSLNLIGLVSLTNKSAYSILAPIFVSLGCCFFFIVIVVARGILPCSNCYFLGNFVIVSAHFSLVWAISVESTWIIQFEMKQSCHNDFHNGVGVCVCVCLCLLRQIYYYSNIKNGILIKFTLTCKFVCNKMSNQYSDL